MAAGMWTMHDDGSFELQEPYKTMLAEAKAVSTKAWAEALVGYLEPASPYSAEELMAELLRRNRRDEGKMMIVDEFILEALSGDL